MEIKNIGTAVAPLVEFLFHRGGELGSHILERDAVLWTLGPGKRRLDLRQFELEHVGKDRVRRRLGAEYALRLGIGGNECNLRSRPSGVGEIPQRVVVDGEEAARRAV